MNNTFIKPMPKLFVLFFLVTMIFLIFAGGAFAEDVNSVQIIEDYTDESEDTIPPELSVNFLPDFTRYSTLQVTGETEAGAIVTINDQNIVVDEWGVFLGDVSLIEGDNIITVIARDPAGNNATVEKIVKLDTLPPAPTDIKISPSDVTCGDTVQISTLIPDNGSGISYVSFYFTNANGGSYTVPMYYSEAQSRWIGDIYIYDLFLPGIWTLSQIYAEDNAGNYSYTYNSQVVFNVNNPNYDNTLPQINTVWVAPLDVQQGNYVNITADVFDDVSGVAEVWGYFQHNSTDYTLNFSMHYDQLTGKWLADIQVPSDCPNGTFNLASINVEDNWGNTKYYGNQFTTASFNVNGLATLSLDPEYQVVNQGQEFTVFVKVRNITDLYGADAQIQFNPDLLQVIDTDPMTEGIQIDLYGVVSGLSTKNEVDNATGTIWFAVARNGSLEPYGFTGSGQIAAITFKASENASGSTGVWFSNSLLSDNADDPQNIPHDKLSAQVVFDNHGSLKGNVKLQGIPDYNHNGYSGVNVSVEGINLSTLTDFYGNFSFSEIPAGEHKLIFQRPDWKKVFLTKDLWVTVTDGEESDIGTIKLLTGDVSGNNHVEISDLNGMAQAYGAGSYDSHYQYNADLNENYLVDLYDLVLMAKNWDLAGYGYGEETEYGVCGYVYNYQNENPIPYAEISIEGPNTDLKWKTDDQGLFTIYLSTPGIYTIWADGGGYIGDYTTVELGLDNPWPFVNMPLDKIPDINISGIVVDVNNNPLADVVVSVSGGKQTNGKFMSTYTDSTGHYEIPYVPLYDINDDPIQFFTIEAFKFGYALAREEKSLMEDTELGFVLQEAQIIDNVATFDFETEGEWVEGGFWHRVANDGSEIINAAFPKYVTLPVGDTSQGSIPDTPFGNYAYWYGQDSTGNFIGIQEADDDDLSGGTSVEPNQGDLRSPVIDLTDAQNPMLQFQSWWEIEGVNPNETGFDLMTIGACVLPDEVDEEEVYYELGRLNPWVDPAEPERDHLAFTSGGFNRPGVWVPYTFNLSQFAGQKIELKFNFDTRDPLYNGFRGWFLDEVAVYEMDTPSLNGGAATFQSLSVPDGKLMEREKN